MSQIICIGSLAKDVFFPTGEGKIIDNSADAKEKQLIAFELGAKYQIEDRFEALGGCAANVSLGMTKLGVEVSALGRVGQDDLGQEIIETLKKNGVETSLVQIDEKAKSDLSLILVNVKDGERTIFFNRDANEKLVLQGEELAGEYFLVSALNGAWRENMEIIEKVSQEKQVKIIYNPGQANLKEDLERVKRFIAVSEVLILNLDEAIEILGEEKEQEAMLKDLSLLGPKIVVMTLGDQGVVGMKDGEFLEVKGEVFQAVDSTGAGDAFLSAFSAAFVQGEEFSQCLKWGILNGGSVVKFYGASQGLLTKEEIKNKINSI